MRKLTIRDFNKVFDLTDSQILFNRYLAVNKDYETFYFHCCQIDQNKLDRLKNSIENKPVKLIEGKRLNTKIIKDFVSLTNDLNKAFELYHVDFQHLADYMKVSRKHLYNRRTLGGWTVDEIVQINNYLHR